MKGMPGYSHGFHWTDEAKAAVEKWRSLGMTMAEIAANLGVSPGAVDNFIRRTGVPRLDRRILVPDIKVPPPIEELLDYVVKGQDLLRAIDPRQREAFPEYKTDKWIGLVIHGDWHFEHYKTDLRSLITDLRAIGAEQDVFYLFNGDVGDWADIRFKGYNMPSVIIPIELRYELIYHLASHIPNLLAVVAGCHDDWLKNRGFCDIIGRLQQKRNEKGLPTYYLGYGGTLHFKVGEATYRIAAFHKNGAESAVNDFLPCVRYLQKTDALADVVAIAHRHDKVGVSFQYFQHRPVVLIRSGSHQYMTDYAWKEGFSGAIARAPMVLLNGAQKEMRACVDYRQGLADLKRLNSEKPEKKK